MMSAIRLSILIELAAAAWKGNTGMPGIKKHSPWRDHAEITSLPPLFYFIPILFTGTQNVQEIQVYWNFLLQSGQHWADQLRWLIRLKTPVLPSHLWLQRSGVESVATPWSAPRKIGCHIDGLICNVRHSGYSGAVRIAGISAKRIVNPHAIYPLHMSLHFWDLSEKVETLMRKLRP